MPQKTTDINMHIKGLNSARIAKIMAKSVPQPFIDDLLKRHRRKFSPRPKGYVQPDAITGSLLHIVSETHVDTFESSHISHIASRYCINEFNKIASYPWYFVDKELSTDMAMVDPPKELPLDFILPPYALLAFQEDALQTSTGSIAYIAYSIIQPGQICSLTYSDRLGRQRNETLPPLDFKQILWFAVEYGLSRFGGRTGLIKQKNSYLIDHEDFDPSGFGNEALESRETGQVLSMLLNSLVYAEANESEKLMPPKLGYGQTLHSAQPKQAKPQSPIFLGVGYQSVQRNNHRDGSHASPKTHWRKGHWKRVAVGQERSKRKWTLIKPTLVNAPK